MKFSLPLRRAARTSTSTKSKGPNVQQAELKLLPIISRTLDRLKRTVVLNPTQRVHNPKSRRVLKGADQDITAITCVPKYNLIVTTSKDTKARVYRLDAETNEPHAVFSKHNGCVNGVEFLFDDVVATVGNDANIFTWHTTSAYPVSEFHIAQARWLTAICKLDDNMLAVGSQTGTLYILSHTRAANFKIMNQIHNVHSSFIKNIALGPSCMATIGYDRTTYIWDNLHFKPVAKLRHIHPVLIDEISDQAINHDFIVACCEKGRIDLYRNQPLFPLECIFKHKNEAFESVTILNDDLLMVVGRSGHLGFISISQKVYKARVTIRSFGWLTKAYVLSDARIAIGDSFGACIIVTPPKIVAHAVQEYANRVSHNYRN